MFVAIFVVGCLLAWWFISGAGHSEARRENRNGSDRGSYWTGEVFFIHISLSWWTRWECLNIAFQAVFAFCAKIQRPMCVLLRRCYYQGHWRRHVCACLSTRIYPSVCCFLLWISETRIARIVCFGKNVCTFRGTNNSVHWKLPGSFFTAVGLQRREVFGITPTWWIKLIKT